MTDSTGHHVLIAQPHTAAEGPIAAAVRLGAVQCRAQEGSALFGGGAGRVGRGKRVQHHEVVDDAAEAGP